MRNADEQSLGALLVCLGCYNRILWIGWLINNRNLSLTVLEADKSKIKAPAYLVSGEGLLPGLETAIFSLCPYRAEGLRELSGVFFIRALFPFMRTLPKAPPPNIIILGVRFQHVNFGEHKHSVYSRGLGNQQEGHLITWTNKSLLLLFLNLL